MERRRPRLDPLVAEQAHERLARLLAEHPPRRAQDAVLPAPPPAVVPPDEIGEEDLPALPPRRFARRHLAVVGGLVLLAALMAGWSMLRSRPVAIADPGGVVTTTSPGTPAASASGSGEPTKAPRIVVHVLGAVDQPGLVRLAEGSRVQDAIDAAGGLRDNADPGELNLAQVLSDGQQVLIGRRGEAAGEVRDGAGGSASGDGSTGETAVLDLNRATVAQLEQLPGVGPVTAGKIVAWRDAHGRFSRAEELQEVDGIGPKTYAQIAPHVRV